MIANCRLRSVKYISCQNPLARITQCLIFISLCPIILAMWIVDPPITASLGSSVALPCNITPPTTQDVLLLLLFYRNESNQPLYTLDSRQTSILSNATFYYAQEIGPQVSSIKDTNSQSSSSNVIPMTSSKRGTNNRRYEFQLKSPISYMHIKQLNSADAGIYRCRLDFRHSRTINRLMRLLIIEPISAVQIFSSGQLMEQTAGPFNEDVYTNFTCKAVGGNPPAKVRWIIEQNNRARHQRLNILPIEPKIIKEINGSTNTTINIKLTRSFYEQRLTCEAENESNKLHHTIQIDLNLKPDKIQVQSEQIGPLKAGDKAKYHCTASGGSSRINVSWWKSELKEERLALLNESLRPHFFAKVSDNEVLEFKVSPDDHGKVLKCKVKMNTLDTFELTEHVAIQVMFKPIVSLVMGASANSQLLEGTDIFFECNVQANPSVNKVSWLFNGRPLDHSRYLNELKNQTKKLIKQTKHQKDLADYQQTDHKQNRNQLAHSNRTNKQRIKQRSRKELMDGQEIGRIIFRNEDHSLMSISSANRQQNGQYECVVNNSIGTTHSESVTLDIKYTSTCETEHLYRTIRNIKQQTTKNITLNCPLVPGNPRNEQTVCWFLNNQSSVEYCNDLNSNRTFTLYDLLTDASNDLSNSISNNDEENTLLDVKDSRDSEDTGMFVNAVVDKLFGGDELQLLCWSVNAAGTQQKPCTIHLAETSPPAQLIDCQVYNTTSYSLSVECELDKKNQWRIEQPITYQLDVNDDQTDAPLFQLVNSKQPTFELNQLPPGRSLRLTVYSINKKGTSNKLSLRTSTLIPSKWRAVDQQKNPLETIKPALYIGFFALFLCLLFALLLLLNRVKNRHPTKLPSSSVDEVSSSNMVKLEQINFGLDSVLSDITNTVQATSNSALHMSSMDSEQGALNCIELLAHDDVSAINNESSMFMRFANNDYASFGKVDSNVQLVNAICLHYTPTTTFNHLQSDIEECAMTDLPSLSTNCICKHCFEE